MCLVFSSLLFFFGDKDSLKAISFCLSLQFLTFKHQILAIQSSKTKIPDQGTLTPSVILDDGQNKNSSYPSLILK